MQRFLGITFFLICSAHASEVLAAEITRGVMLSNSCAACHGTDGKSPGAIPRINGKSAQYISQTLHEFREGKRAATVMGRHATGYTDEEIELIADYFSSQP
jgi:sulfide dehydrogenase cytochrome subunit